MKSLIAVLLFVSVMLGALSPAFGYRDLEAGVFITRDPAGFVDGPNLYTYVRQNPWTYFDPLGLFLPPGANTWHPMADEGTPEQRKFWGNAAGVTAVGVVGVSAVMASGPVILGAALANPTAVNAGAIGVGVTGTEVATNTELAPSVNDVGGAVFKSGGKLMGALDSAGNAIKGTFSRLDNAINGAFGRLNDAFGKLSQRATKAATEAATNAPRTTTGPAKNLSGAVEDAANAARSQPHPRQFTKHANERMQTRNVSEARVEEAIQKGNTKVGTDTAVSNIPANQSASGRGATVVTNSREDVVTVMDKGSKSK